MAALPIVIKIPDNGGSPEISGVSTPITLVRGESWSQDFYLRDERDEPIDLTSATEIVAAVKDSTPPGLTSVSLTGAEIAVASPTTKGKFNVKITAVKSLLVGLTADLETAGSYSTLQFSFTITGDNAFAPNIIKIPNFFNVVDPIS